MTKTTRWILGIIIFLFIVAIAVVAQFWDASTSAPRFDRSRQEDGVTDVDNAEPQNERSLGAFAPAPPGGGSPLSDSAFDLKLKEPVTSPLKTLSQDRMIVRTATLSIIARNVTTTVNELKASVEAMGGYVVSAVISKNDETAPSASMSFRIPAAQLDAALEAVHTKAVRIVRESVTGEDVTEEFVDIQARLKNLLASESQLQTIMLGAKTTEDVLAVRRELERVRGEIDSLTGRKKYLESQVSLSTVNVSIATDEASLPIVNEGDQWQPFVIMVNAMGAFLFVLQFLANTAIWLVIFLPLWGTIYLVVRIVRRRRNRKR